MRLGAAARCWRRYGRYGACLFFLLGTCGILGMGKGYYDVFDLEEEARNTILSMYIRSVKSKIIFFWSLLDLSICFEQVE